MAYIRAEIKLQEVFRTVCVQLYFPTDLPQEIGNKVRGVVTLLHGMSNTSSDWLLMSSATRYAADNGYILVMPDANNSFYTNMQCDIPYFDMLTTLLPQQLAAIFNIPTNREQNHIAGLSMGGYGAVNIGYNFPHRYANIGSFSGCLDMAFLLDEARGQAASSVLQAAFGPNLKLAEQNNLFTLAEKVSALPSCEKPNLFCTCGNQDAEYLILEQNKRFQQHVEALPLPSTFQYWDGLHEWNVWDRSFAAFISHIENSDYLERKQQDWNAPTCGTPSLHSGDTHHG